MPEKIQRAKKNHCLLMSLLKKKKPMAKMRNLNTKTFSAILTLILFGLPAVALAANLSVNFQYDPLFSELDVKPGDSVIRTVIVTNNSDSPQQVATESINEVDNEGLGSAMRIDISDSSGPLYSSTLATFLNSGEVSLSSLASGASETYSYTISFPNTDDNTLQRTTLGFDLCVGFLGGDLLCGEIPDDGGGDGDGDGDGDGGGGGGGSSQSAGGGFVAGDSDGGEVLGAQTTAIPAGPPTPGLGWVKETGIYGAFLILIGIYGLLRRRR